MTGVPGSLLPSHTATDLVALAINSSLTVLEARSGSYRGRPPVSRSVPWPVPWELWERPPPLPAANPPASWAGGPIRPRGVTWSASAPAPALSSALPSLLQGRSAALRAAPGPSTARGLQVLGHPARSSCPARARPRAPAQGILGGLCGQPHSSVSSGCRAGPHPVLQVLASLSLWVRHASW